MPRTKQYLNFNLKNASSDVGEKMDPLVYGVPAAGVVALIFAL